MINVKRLNRNTYFPSSATIYQRTSTQGNDGQPINTYNVALYTNVPCRKSPNILMRAANTEYRRGEGYFVREIAEFQLSCQEYLPNVTQECRLTVDGIWYDVLGVEHDGNNQYTRIHIGDNRPFNPD